MNFFKRCVIAAICTIPLWVGAGQIRFRSGVILGAELTTRNIPVAKADKNAFPEPPEKRIYAVLTVKLDPMRKISIFDYSLEAYGIPVPCVAINESGKFVYHTEEVMSTNTLQLLFILDGRQVGLQKNETLKLKSNLPPPGGIFDTDIPFEMRNSAAPRSISQIPQKGLFPDLKNTSETEKKK